MNDDGFTVRTKRWSAALWIPVGVAFLYLAVDLRFLHHIPGATGEASESWIVFLILACIGLGILYPAIRAILKPRTLLSVDHNGITISAAGDHLEWNNESGRMEPVIQYGQERSIPWSFIERIEAGTIECISERSTGGTVVSRSESSVTRIGGATGRSSQKRPALRILCRREVSMEQISVRNLIQARTGDEPGEISSEDRAKFSAEEIKDLTCSEFLIDVRLLPGSLDQVIGLMEQFRKKST